MTAPSVAPSAAALRARVAEVADDAPGPWSSGAAEQLAAAHRALADALAAQLGAGDADEARRLHALAGELVERGAIARLRAVERLQAATDRLSEVGPVSEIVERAVVEAAQAADLDRVLLSRVADARLVVDRIHAPDGAAHLPDLQAGAVPLEYPLAEAEMLRQRRAKLIARAHEAVPGRHAFADVMRWRDYVAAPIVLEGRVIGFFHGDRDAARESLRALDRDVLWSFACLFAGLFERAVLRRRLRVQRQELRQVASWADARTSELSDGAIDLGADRHGVDTAERVQPTPRRSVLDDLLTRREVDVLERLAKGESNAEIAHGLVVSEGTVKFHVKNILRKLNASNRAEAASRYVRVALSEGEGRRGRDRA